MIPDYSRYYGCVFTELVEGRLRLNIERLSVGIQGVYLLEKSLPLYVKFSRTRRGPWAFTFQSDHQMCLDALKKQFGQYIAAFVCGSDGIVALDDRQLREILDDTFENQEGVTIRRKLRRMYSVSGTNGQLARKVGRDSLISLVDRLTGRVSSSVLAERDEESASAN